jgi:DNA-3-methyladenine glycosylase
VRPAVSSVKDACRNHGEECLDEVQTGSVSADVLATDPVSAARLLVGAVLTGRGVTATVVEVEAYGGPPDGPWPDPASHSFRGAGGRNLVMFGPPGRLYAYRSHGIHVCANVVCGEVGVAAAVLLRAAVVTDGADVALARRGPVRPAAMARGPGNLCSALGITMADNGIDLFGPDGPVRLTIAAPQRAVAGPRVGVSKAADWPWRFSAPDSPEVSSYRRSPRAPAPGNGD